MLVQYTDEAGIPIKPLETWQSHNLFEYSRKYHYNGVQVSTVLKKISRLASEANQVVLTLNGDLSGLYSTGSSAASYDVTPTYTCTMFEAAHMLRRCIPWLKEKDDSHSISLVTTSRTLGGFPVTSYPNFCMRAIQDPLTFGLQLARTILRDPVVRTGVSTYITLQEKSRIEFESLIKDPSSLPLSTQLQSEHHLRDMIMDIIIVNLYERQDHIYAMNLLVF